MKAVALLINPLVIDAWLCHLDRPVARLDVPRGMMTIADDQPMALLVQMLAVALDIFIDLPLDGRLQGQAGAIAKNVIDRRRCCQIKLKCVTVHEAYLSVPRGTMVNRLSRSTEGTPLLFSRQPSTTFGYSSTGQTETGSNGMDVVLSHDGRWIAHPNG